MSSENIDRLTDMIAGIDVAMVTSVDADGMLHSRPMGTQAVHDERTLYFFTSAETSLAYQTQENAYVNVSYVDAKRSIYISISGIATVLDDREKIAKVWDPSNSAWFPKGLEDPDLRLLSVEIESAEFWDVASNALTLLFGYARKAITGKSDGIGTHERIV
ncbi:MAG: pyridoxamine 5'-phosphate oxidase family protein [Candidatus Eremiobacteraeota bacterium]|nr:pyridoxamine 5'-phosphate oxidase family protein [Candidatus Eremiobacteraeota bacterium]